MIVFFAGILLLGSGVFAQEICTNGIDDEPDGYVDCYDSECAGMGPCAGFFFGQTATCQYVPGTATFSMVPKWRTDSTRFDVFSTLTPVAGDVDNDGIVEVFGYNHNNLTAGSGGPGNKVYMFEGINGTILDSIVLPVNANTQMSSGITLGDVDGDGLGEIIVSCSDNIYRCYEHDMTFKYATPSIAPFQAIPNLADCNQDGVPELYASNYVFNGATGALIIAPAFPPAALGAPPVSGGLLPFGMSVAADVLPAGFCADCAGLELIAGHQVFSINIGTGTRTLQVTSANGADGFTAIADYDKDGDLDAIISSDALFAYPNVGVYAWDLQTATVLATSPPIASPTFFTVGQANLGDFDNDGLLEVGVVTEDSYQVLEDHLSGLSIKWAHGVTDESGFTASVLFDFQGDGEVEVVYQDEDSLYVFAGNDGTTLANVICRGGTVMNHPIVLDADGDDRTEIVCGCSEGVGLDPRLHGYLTAYGPGTETWVNSREVWNQHSYFITNINDDLSIPIQQQQHHIVGDSTIINGFNIQSTVLTPGATPTYAASDATPSNVSLDVSNCQSGPNTVDISWDITNLSAAAVFPDNTPIAIYAGNPLQPGATLIDTVHTRTVHLAQSQVESFTHTIPDQGGGPVMLYIVVNDSGHTVTPITFPSAGVGECDFTNNIDSIMLSCLNAPPVAVDDRDTTIENTAVVIDVQDNDSDPDGDPLTTINISSGPSNGAAVILNNDSIQYTPNAGFIGLDSLEYVIDDGNGNTDTALVVIFVEPDTDGDGISNSNDLDDDNDGIPDLVELGGLDPDLDTDGDGTLDWADSDAPGFVDANGDGIDDRYDTDFDGTPNHLDIDADNDGLADAVEANGGTIPANYDNGTGMFTGVVGDNGIPDAAETAPESGISNLPITNSDGDALPDYLDIDADNDGIVDNIEVQTTAGYVAPSGNDLDGNGRDDAYDGVGALTPTNTDGTTTPDYRDLDSDDDGVPDLIEGHDNDMNGVADVTPAGTDADGDGLDDNFDTVANPGAGNSTGSNAPLQDTDGDAASGGDRDWRDTDDDNDGIPTASEDFNTNGNWADDLTQGGGTTPDYLFAPDNDNDGIPDFVDIDDDNDGIPDLVETGGLDPNADANGNGVPDWMDPAAAGFVDANGDNVDDRFDTDFDGVPNHYDIDADDDGLADGVEANGGTVPANFDNATGMFTGAVGPNGMPDASETAPESGITNLPVTNSDGDALADYLDIDADNDGIVDNIEVQTTAGYVAPSGNDLDGNGRDDAYDGAGALVPTNTDGTTTPDYRDLDSDDDGVPDLIEGHDNDMNGVADVTPAGTDADGDGLDDNFDTVANPGANNSTGS
ncbi:MAG: Ig-like domain-containing protein, partial [Bacteroidota bacterium]